MRIGFLRLSFFVWIIVPIALYLTYMAWGLPHIAWSYSWVGTNYDPHAPRWYTRCTFIGPYGSFTIHPSNGKCGWFRFFKQNGERG